MGMRLGGRLALLVGGTRPYSPKVLATEPANLLAYWPLSEASGAVAVDASGNGRNATYVGVTLGQAGVGDGLTCPLFDGANDYVDIYSASLSAAFNGITGSMMIWCKVSAAGVWTDGISRRLFRLYGDGNNLLSIFKSTTNNRMTYTYKAGGILESFSADGLSSAEWLAFTMTWSDTADQVKVFVNGVQSGATQTGIGTWDEPLETSNTQLGASSMTPTEVWSGWLAHCAIWTKVLTPAQILALATV